MPRKQQQEPHPITPGTGLAWELLCHPDAADLQTFSPVASAPKLQSPGVKDMRVSFWHGSSCPPPCTVSGVGKRYL